MPSPDGRTGKVCVYDWIISKDAKWRSFDCVDAISRNNQVGQIIDTFEPKWTPKNGWRVAVKFIGTYNYELESIDHYVDGPKVELVQTRGFTRFAAAKASEPMRHYIPSKDNYAPYMKSKVNSKPKNRKHKNSEDQPHLPKYSFSANKLQKGRKKKKKPFSAPKSLKSNCNQNNKSRLDEFFATEDEECVTCAGEVHDITSESGISSICKCGGKMTLQKLKISSTCVCGLVLNVDDCGLVCLKSGGSCAICVSCIHAHVDDVIASLEQSAISRVPADAVSVRRDEGIPGMIRFGNEVNCVSGMMSANIGNYQARQDTTGISEPEGSDIEPCAWWELINEDKDVPKDPPNKEIWSDVDENETWKGGMNAKVYEV